MQKPATAQVFTFLFRDPEHKHKLVIGQGYNEREILFFLYPDMNIVRSGLVATKVREQFITDGSSRNAGARHDGCFAIDRKDIIVA